MAGPATASFSPPGLWLAQDAFVSSGSISLPPYAPACPRRPTEPGPLLYTERTRPAPLRNQLAPASLLLGEISGIIHNEPSGAILIHVALRPPGHHVTHHVTALRL